MTWMAQIVEIFCLTDLEVKKKKPEIKLLTGLVSSLDWSIFFFAYGDLSQFLGFLGWWDEGITSSPPSSSCAHLSPGYIRIRINLGNLILI